MVKAAFHLEETRFLLKIKLNKTFEKKNLETNNRKSVTGGWEASQWEKC